MAMIVILSSKNLLGYSNSKAKKIGFPMFNYLGQTLASQEKRKY